MRYQKLELAARTMSAAEREDCLRLLVADPRFPAVVALLIEQKELAADHACGLQFANSHGCLEHAAGVQYGMRELLGKIRAVCEPGKRRGMQRPAERQI